MFHHLKIQNEKINGFGYFLEAIYPPILFILGLFGNIMSFAVFSRKKLSRLSFRNMGRLMAIADIIYLLQLPEDFFTYYFDYNIRDVSVLTCKLFRYFNFCLGPIPAWLLVYISYDRAISTVYPGKYLIFKTTNFKLCFILIIILFNLVFYIPIILYHEKISLTNITNTYMDGFECYFNDLETAFVVVNMDLLNSTLLPFFLMTISSSLIIHKLIKIRTKVLRKGKDKMKKIRKDIRFSVTTILLNFMFFILNFPICLIQFVPSYLYCLLALYLYYTSYAINFYVFFFFNSIFRREFLHMIRFPYKKKKKNSDEHTFHKQTTNYNLN